MATSSFFKNLELSKEASFTTELKFDTEEKVSSFLEAIENTKNNKPLDIDVEYEFIKGNDIKKFFEETSEKKGE